MSKKQINDLVTELTFDSPIGDDEAFDIADSILFEEDGLEEGIKKHFNIVDVQGWLANKIS